MKCFAVNFRIYFVCCRFSIRESNLLARAKLKYEALYYYGCNFDLSCSNLKILLFLRLESCLRRRVAKLLKFENFSELPTAVGEFSFERKSEREGFLSPSCGTF